MTGARTLRAGRREWGQEVPPDSAATSEQGDPSGRVWPCILSSFFQELREEP